MKIEAIRMTNFKAFRKARMLDIPQMCVVVGANGTGKTTLFDLFGFLKEALKSNIRIALNRIGGSRGFDEVRTRGTKGPIEIELKFRERSQGPLITYSLSIDSDEFGKACVRKEVLKYRRGSSGKPWHFLDFAYGKGYAVTNEMDEVGDVQDLQRDQQALKSPDILAIKGLAQFEKFPAVVALGNLIENWCVSDLYISKMRAEPETGLAEHLSREGENLALVLDFLHNYHRGVFDTILRQLAKRVPGMTSVESKLSEETGRVLLKFQDGSFQEPFMARYVSDGTIKMLAYLVLLYDPGPHPLLCVEEPENQLYPLLLTELAEEFRLYAGRGGQVFVSTHSPDFLNAIELDEVFWLVKEDGYTAIRRAREDQQVAAYMADGDKMGYLWKQGFFTGADPQ